ncbi:MAG: GerMN domain-containing protein [Acidimicrobiales bacterium]
MCSRAKSNTSTPIAFDVYFIRSGILVAVARHATRVPAPADVIKALPAGPTSAPVDAGHRTALTGPDIISRTRNIATVVTVDLARTFNEIPRNDRIFALGQITLTLTGRPGVDLVQYTIADAPTDVPKANGVVTRDPVARADYISLLQATTPTSTGSSSTTSG